MTCPLEARRTAVVSLQRRCRRGQDTEAAGPKGRRRFGWCGRVRAAGRDVGGCRGSAPRDRVAGEDEPDRGHRPVREQPAEAFNFDPQPPEHVLYLETTSRRVRVHLHGEPVARGTQPGRDRAPRRAVRTQAASLRCTAACCSRLRAARSRRLPPLRTSPSSPASSRPRNARVGRSGGRSDQRLVTWPAATTAPSTVAYARRKTMLPAAYDRAAHLHLRTARHRAHQRRRHVVRHRVLVRPQVGEHREVAGDVEQRGDDAAVQDSGVVQRRLLDREGDAAGRLRRIEQRDPEEAVQRDVEDARTRARTAGSSAVVATRSRPPLSRAAWPR